jgi:hypothetical protein
MVVHGLGWLAPVDASFALVDFLCSPMCGEPMGRGDLTVEPYDLTEHNRLIDEHPLPSAWETPI